MYNRIMGLSLLSMSNDYYNVLRYLIKNSDELTLVMHMVKPYSVQPNPCKEVEYSACLEPYIISQELNARQWPFTKTSEKHLALCRYKCSKPLLKALIDKPSLFTYRLGVIPSDLCLYRDRKCWFATILHEGWAFAIDPNQNDMIALNKHIGMDRPLFM